MMAPLLTTTPTTLPELLGARAARTPDEPAVFQRDGQRDGAWVGSTWGELLSLVERVAASLHRLGIGHGDRVAVLAPTSTRWLVAEMATLRVGGVVVGVDPQAPAAQSASVLRGLGVRAIFADTPARLAGFSGLGHLLSFGAGADGVIGWGALDVAAPLDVAPPAAGDVAILLFTSGTTGAPRAIPYTHDQVLWALRAVRAALADLGPSDRMIAWLPMANLFQRMVNLLAVERGAVSFFVPDPRAIMAEIAELRPTFFVGVPRFYEKLSSSGQTPLMGGRLRYALTGSAPIAPAILASLRDQGVLVLEAYGLSENTVPMAINRPGDYRFGSVGRPLPENEIRRAPDGELLVRGPGVFRGYDGEPGPGDRFTADGFYRTGDLGHFDDDGFLYLDGRKADTFKVSTGHQVSPSRVESAYAGIPGIDQLVVLGHGRPHVVALVVPSPAALADALLAEGLEAPVAPASSPAVRAYFARAFERGAPALAPHERVRDFAVLAEPFSVAAGELTSSLKLRRGEIVARRREVIDALYGVEKP